MDSMNKGSNGMNNPQTNDSLIARERRMLPFLIEFVKFSTGFVVIVAIALFALQAASAAML